MKIPRARANDHFRKTGISAAKRLTEEIFNFSCLHSMQNGKVKQFPEILFI